MEANTLETPTQLAEKAQHYWQAYQHACQDKSLTTCQDDVFLQSYRTVFALSEFVAEQCSRHPEIVADLFGTTDVSHHYESHTYLERLTNWLQDCQNPAQLNSLLRQFRRREMIRIAWRDLMGWAKLETTIANLTQLADATLQASLHLLYNWQCQQYGTPYSKTKTQQYLEVIAVGKLGSRELNFSSDIDLIFSYPSQGSTDKNDMSCEQFFIRLSQQLINALHTITAEGFVFRVDMRLRPFGSTGPLAMRHGTLQNYYQEQGRDWERYALLKARIVTSSGTDHELMSIINKFVYHQGELDYQAISALRKMHKLMAEEVKKKDLADDIKAGPGGIRQVEFIVQAWQLIRGGVDHKLRNAPLLSLLPRLVRLNHLTIGTARELEAAYRFLRNSEHRMQMFSDKQTQTLPQDSYQQLCLAYSMGFEDWQSYLQALNKHRERIDHHFYHIVALPEQEPASEQEANLPVNLQTICAGTTKSDQGAQSLSTLGFEDGTEALRLLDSLRTSKTYKELPGINKSQLDNILPALVAQVARTANPLQSLKRLLPLIETTMVRRNYLALLYEKPVAIAQLVRLSAASPWVTEQLTRYPHLLGELLDTRNQYKPPDMQRFAEELHQQLQTIATSDSEQQIDCLRWYKQAQVLRIASADVMGNLSLMRVSDYLSDSASVILRLLQRLVWEQLVAKHGMPYHGNAGQHCDFAIVAYGKLGGIELGYSSDLDLVFLHDCPHGAAMTSGKDPISHHDFYKQLGQAILHMLSQQTANGILYKVDMRLRPAGKAGPLVSNVDAFAEYQKQHAWTWEHQALVRARVVSGANRIAQHFYQLRKRRIARSGEISQLAKDIVDMRDKMRKAEKSPEAGFFDLKYGLGGITDIEFIAQFGALAWSRYHPSLLAFTDNIRLLEGFAHTGLMPDADIQLLCDAYRHYRAAIHRLDLQNKSAIVEEQEFTDYQRGVKRIWQNLFTNLAA